MLKPCADFSVKPAQAARHVQYRPLSREFGGDPSGTLMFWCWVGKDSGTECTYASVRHHLSSRPANAPP